MVHGFDSISIAQFPAMICSVSTEGSLNRFAHLIQMFILLTLSKSFLFILCAFNACLPLRILAGKKHRQIKLQRIRNSTNMGVWAAGTLNQLLIRGS